MYIEELKGGEESGIGEEEKLSAAELVGGGIVVSGAKRILIGAGARALFYPTLLYNVVRNKMQAEFRWWDLVDEFVLLGAVPFPSDVERLKELGVCGVVTLNEPYETLVPTSLYQAYGIDHLVLPTRDYLFAPSLSDICQAVNFIHEHASQGLTTYVHCKAGRGRSTTIVICYLAVLEFYHLKKKISMDMTLCHESGAARSEIWADLSLVYRVRVVGHAALARLSCLWLRCHTHQKISSDSRSIRLINWAALV
ncbi:hypothetical protein F0562_007864 [Nyssa sinensis]|uniref:Uncharacterized protein n=1 Tax=Nyssa sinensis TaxID=561372 RepID=A0A5J5A893_9ASTE|nr:hypothetical protein F0562_007864 [Nyssa sinensis]